MNKNIEITVDEMLTLSKNVQDILNEKTVNDEIDKLEDLLLSNFPLVDCPLKHTFVPGMYIREIFMPKGSVVTSMIHKTKHPYFIIDGAVLVYSENDGEQFLQCGDRGITMPGTRRVLKIIEEVAINPSPI